ncbi:fluoride efflux transporter FluC [Arthrobacter sp. ERGS1:01]|uniref:fluoride efflux transporter FluC n=1 Tax=Arthrobacter sp. ERGS1:01 TaxID=1704044 RepID=UPI001ED9905E|nr:CrcB family protein [Arthrobacter sp. ERGS1:01]
MWLLVAVGGALGAAAREGLTLVIPTVGGVPLAIGLINLAGAFVLGCLYEALTRPGIGAVAAGRLRLLLGTGFCGGFTTYSSLATDTAVLGTHGHLGTALLYVVGTVLLGACATVAGIAAGARLARRHGPISGPVSAPESGR